MDKKQPIFVNGVSWKRPSDITKQKAPWVKGHMSFNVPKLRTWLDLHADGEWLNIDLKESKDKTKLYFELNTYKREEKKNLYAQDTEEEQPAPQELPVIDINSELDAEQSFSEF